MGLQGHQGRDHLQDSKRTVSQASQGTVVALCLMRSGWYILLPSTLPEEYLGVTVTWALQEAASLRRTLSAHLIPKEKVMATTHPG